MTHRKTRNWFLEAIRQGKPISIIGPWPVPDNHPLPYMGMEGNPEQLPATHDIADPIHSEEHRGEGLSEDELPSHPVNPGEHRTTLDMDEMSFQEESDP